MNNEIKNEWILAQLKRNLGKMIDTANEKQQYEYVAQTLYDVMLMVLKTESDAVLGTEEIIKQYVDSLPGGDAECDACKIEFTEVQNG